MCRGVQSFSSKSRMTTVVQTVPLKCLSSQMVASACSAVSELAAMVEDWDTEFRHCFGLNIQLCYQLQCVNKKHPSIYECLQFSTMTSKCRIRGHWFWHIPNTSAAPDDCDDQRCGKYSENTWVWFNPKNHYLHSTSWSSELTRLCHSFVASWYGAMKWGALKGKGDKQR